MIRTPVPALLLAFLTPTVGAQTATTWTVDNLNRPGTDFTDINAAVQAVQPGDRLFVRRSTSPYASQLVLDKGVTIAPENGYVVLAIAPTLTITNVPAGQELVWLGGPANPLAPTFQVTVTNCAGTVTLEGLNVQPTLTDAACVHLNHCSIEGISTFGSAYLFQRSRLFLDDTTNASYSRAVPRLDLVSSTLYAQRSPLAGQVAIGGPFGSAPLAAFRLSTDSQVTIGQGCLIWGDSVHPTVEGTGTFVVDPSVTVNGIIDPAVQSRSRPLVDLLDLDNDAQGARILEITSHPNVPHALVFGTPSTPGITLPGIGDVWLAPLSIQVLTYLQTDATGRARTAIPLSTFFPRYYLLEWQALAVPQSGLWEISNPVLTYVR